MRLNKVFVAGVVGERWDDDNPVPHGSGQRRTPRLCSRDMLHLLWIWLVSAVVLLIVAYLIPGFELDGLGSALIAALVVGVLNVTLGIVLKVLTFPLTILTLGLFLLVINAFILWISAALVPGFRIRGFWPAFLGAIVLMLVRLGFRYLGVV